MGSGSVSAAVVVAIIFLVVIFIRWVSSETEAAGDPPLTAIPMGVAHGETWELPWARQGHWDPDFDLPKSPRELAVAIQTDLLPLRLVPSTKPRVLSEEELSLPTPAFLKNLSPRGVGFPILLHPVAFSWHSCLWAVVKPGWCSKHTLVVVPRTCDMHLPLKIWFGCWLWWCHTCTHEGRKRFIAHITKHSGETGKLPTWSVKLLERTRKGD